MQKAVTDSLFFDMTYSSTFLKDLNQQLDRLSRDQQTLYLLAVSGGVDSMVLLHAFQQLKKNILVAHCNFQLRGDESDGDEAFVLDYCKSAGINAYVKHFDTQSYAAAHKLSIQVAARNLRYHWFRELSQETNSNWVVTAHQADDQLETFLINLSRGSGIAGLSGIPEKSGNLLRPLLSFSRNQLLQYAKEQSLEFREDSSNRKTDYLRNKIRHQLVPVIRDVLPALDSSFHEAISILKEQQDYLQYHLQAEIASIKDLYDTYHVYHLCNLKDFTFLHLILHEILHPLGFSKDVVNKSEKLIISGKTGHFKVDSMILYIERNEMIIDFSLLKMDEISFHITDNEVINYFADFDIQLKSIQDFILNKDKSIACLDAELVGPKLTLRHWQPGDSFIPLGMSGRMKLSDYMVNHKFTRYKKSKTMVLLAGTEICWIVGERISELFKITSATTKVIEIHHVKSLE